MRRPIRRTACAIPAIVLGLARALAPGTAGAETPNASADATRVCGFLPYRPDGAERFAAERAAPESAANVGAQATYPLAWDLARPSFLAAEIADALLAGQSAAAVRATQGAALSLGEYMLHAAADLAAPPAEPDTDDMRLWLAAERPRTFHLLYVAAKADHEAIVAHVTPGAAPARSLEALSASWRPAYALLAKAQADDKRIELLATGLDAAAVAEKEAVACLAHAVRLAFAADTSGSASLAKASAARWAARPPVDARALPRPARAPFFDHEDAGDVLARRIAALPDGPADAAALKDLAKDYAAFVETARALHDTMRAEPAKAE